MMEQRRARVALLVAVLLLAACGPSGDAEPDGSTAPKSLREAIEEPDVGPPADDLRELGAQEFAEVALAALLDAGSLAFRTTTTTVGGQVPGTTELYGALRIHDDRVDQYSTGTGPAAAELVVLDDVLYMRSEQTGLDGQWLKMHLGQGTDSMYGFAAHAHDPVAILGGMADPVEFDFEGVDEVDGIATHRYRVVTKVEDYLAGLRMPAQMAQSLPAEVTAQVWIDGDRLVRRVLQTIAVAAGDGVEATTSTTDIRYSDHGIVVEIRPPDAADVTNEL